MTTRLHHAAGASKLAEPDVAEPDVAEPDVAEPDVAEPDVAEPVVAEPVEAPPGAVPWGEVAFFLALAYALAWWPWPLSTLSTRPNAAVLVPMGPSLAALAVLARRHRRDELRRLLRACVRFRIGRLWWSLVLPVAVPAAALGAAVTLGTPGPAPAQLLLAAGAGLATLPVTLVLAGPLGEELGWRGYLLPALLTRLTPGVATAVVAAAWGAFHLPLVLTRPGQYGLGWALALVGVAVVMTRLHLRSDGSVALAVAFHAVVNTATTVTVTSVAEQHRPAVWLLTGLAWLAAALVVQLRSRSTPTRPRPTATHPQSHRPRNPR